MTEYQIKWRDGDPDWETYQDLDCVSDQMHEEAKRVVDSCEQVICDGGRFEDKPGGDDYRRALIDELWDSLDAKVDRALGMHSSSDRIGAVTCAPWYAREARETFTFAIRAVDAAT